MQTEIAQRTTKPALPHIGDVSVMPRYADFRVLLKDIMDSGRYTKSKVAVVLNVARTNINQVMLGSEPRWAFGDAIWRMHTEVCGIEITKLRLSEFRESARRVMG